MARQRQSDLITLWRAVEQAGGPQAYVNQQLTERGFLVQRRETDGLSYDVRSVVSWNNEEPHSEWQASAIFAPQNRAKVEAAFSDEIKRALSEGFTAQELAEGQRGLLGFRRLSRAQDGNVAGALASNLHLGRTFAVSAKVDKALAELTLTQVNDALRRYVKPADLGIVYAGDFKP